VALCLLAMVVPGCLFGEDRECGPHQVLTEDFYCVCAPGAVMSAVGRGACAPCGANEVVTEGVCACAPGFAKSATGVCAPALPGLGIPCPGGAAECQLSFPVCAPGPQPYCTSSPCASHADCPLDYWCDTTVASPYCRKPPAGQGMSCTSDAACAGTEATYCLPVLNQCRVQDCQADTACGRGARCCDLAKQGLARKVCLPSETCP
jgi:hypothetical protein